MTTKSALQKQPPSSELAEHLNRVVEATAVLVANYNEAIRRKETTRQEQSVSSDQGVYKRSERPS